VTESYVPAATPATAAEAATKLDTLAKNLEWAKGVLTGSGPHVQEFQDLVSKSGSADKLDLIIAGKIEPPIFETTVNGELNSYKIATTVADLRERGLDDATIRQAISNAPVSASERDAAKELRAVRLSDKEWTAKWLAGDRSAQKEMTLLNIIISGGGV
jgi:hypothetical protein